MQDLVRLVTRGHLHLKAMGQHHFPAAATTGIAANLNVGGEK